jgi:dTDP-4-amino-4,6-dideoxygalactose transaminase
MERLKEMLVIKAGVARRYAALCADFGVVHVEPIADARPNWWLNAIIVEDEATRNAVLEFTNARGVMTRPIWRLMSKLPMFSHCQNDGLENSHWLEARVVNLPSSVPDGAMEKHPR